MSVNWCKSCKDSDRLGYEHAKMLLREGIVQNFMCYHVMFPRENNISSIPNNADKNLFFSDECAKYNFTPDRCDI